MTLQQRSKSELSRLDAIFAELGSGEAPVITGRRDLDDICRQRRAAECAGSSRLRQVGDCGKAGYSSRDAALRTARIRMSSGACRLRVYHCPDCKMFISRIRSASGGNPSVTLTPRAVTLYISVKPTLRGKVNRSCPFDE